jgi:hypothetical protein
MLACGSLGTLTSMSVYYISYMREFVGLKSVRYSENMWLVSLNSIVNY